MLSKTITQKPTLLKAATIWPNKPSKNLTRAYSTNDKLSLIHSYIISTEKALLNAPSGRIQLHSSKGYPRFYYYENNDSVGKYVSANDLFLISSICQRDYNNKALLLLYKLQNAIAKGIDVNIPYELDKIYHAFKPGKRELISPLITPIEEYVNQWYSTFPPSQNKYPMSINLETNKGEFVRSKSEKIIADKLFAMNIPYAYEPALTLNGKTKYPDFLVLNRITRETYIWEHFGLSDSNEYSDNNLAKLADYEHSGYYLGKSLIATFESKEHPLDSTFVDKKIEAFLL